MDYEIVNKKRVLQIIQTLDCSEMKKYEFKTQFSCILDLLEEFFGCGWGFVRRMRFKIAMVNHFPFLFRFHFAKINLRKFMHIRGRYMNERVNTHLYMHSKSGWVERKRIAISVYSVALCRFSFRFFRVPFLWRNIKFRKW